MSIKVVHYSECDYQSDRFVALRRAERSRFPAGQEVEIEFTGRNAFEGFGMARRAAKVYAGLLSDTETMPTIPFVSDKGPYQGRVMGRQSPDHLQGWRIDWNPRRNAFHVNWWDRRNDPSGNRDRSKHFYGANYITGAAHDLFWEIESHFPGQVKRVE